MTLTVLDLVETSLWRQKRVDATTLPSSGKLQHYFHLSALSETD